MRRLACAFLTLALAACTKEPSKKPEDQAKGKTSPTTQKVAKTQPEPIPPPPDVAAAPGDAQVTASGLASKVLQPGTGAEHPAPEDRVTVNYTGWTTDGKMFDSSTKRGKPATFALNRVIPGWTEGMQLMVVGEKRRFWIPQELAYKGRPGAPAGMLVFDVELVSITKGPKPQPPPEDVAAPPKDAKVEKSGLATKVIKKGTGNEHPKATSVVQVQYTGWTTDGKMFDSSLTRGRPASFPVNAVIPGWGEGIQLMVVGEQRRLWIPEALGYKGKPGSPQGMLVFDVELLSVADVSAPPDVAAPPKDAKVEKSGIASKVLKKGTGSEHPTAASTVQVHYTGWTTDGKMFDSSLTRGQPAKFALGQVIPGWTEGVQLMTVGEKRRFWIPQDLAYKGQPGAPAGMLVFDIELLAIEQTPPGAPPMPPGAAGPRPNPHQMQVRPMPGGHP